MKPSFFAFIFAAVSATAFAAPKAIITGWDIGRMTPERLVASADELDKLPFDGVSFALNFRDDEKEELDGYLRAAVNRLFPRDELLRRFVPVFREAVKHKSLANSFVCSMFQPIKRMDWRDDAAWAAFAENMRTLARLAKEGGLKGILLDTEDYWRARQYALLPSDKMTFAEAGELARRRGREIFKGVFEEFPDIDILTFWWLSIRYEYFGAHDGAEIAKSLGDLLPSFTDGVLDVMPMTARLFDGNEHTYHWSHWRSFVAQRAFHPLLVSEENRRKARALTYASSAFYLDMFINPQTKADGTPHPFYMAPAGGRRLNRFLDRYEDAALMSEEYIWLFGERRSYIDWGKFNYCRRYEDAYTNGTWNAALPGFYEELAILKNPRGELLPRLKAEKAAGMAVNLAGEAVSTDGGFSYSCEVKGTKYGEWYAICIEAVSDHPSASIRLKHGNSSLWDRPTATVVFAPGGENGRRRGVGFQRIWGGADTLTVSYSYGMTKTKSKDVKISVYRVYEPK